MKCRYRFPLTGRLRLNVSVPIPTRGWEVEFQTTGGIVSHVTVMVPLPNREDWPVVREDPEPGVKAHFEVRTPHLPWIQRELRAIQGMLSLFGLRSIGLENPEVEWLPETDAERAELQLQSLKKEVKPAPDEEIEPLSFDLIARAVLAADRATQVDTPLNFFRRGMLDIYQHEYIEAIYDFYFVLETVFGEGNFKNAAVADAFLASTQLRSCVQRALEDPGPLMTHNPKTREKFNQVYGPLSVEEAVEKIISLRGYLHHHTEKRRNAWHPDEQNYYEVDALFLQSIAFNVAFSFAEPHMWHEEIVREYETLMGHSSNGDGNKDTR